MEASFSGRARVPEHVVHRSFDGSTVLLNLDNGQYHGLNQTGGRMLELIEETGDLGVVVQRIAGEYDRSEAEVSEDLVDFCAMLAERGLLELDDVSASG